MTVMKTKLISQLIASLVLLLAVLNVVGGVEPQMFAAMFNTQNTPMKDFTMSEWVEGNLRVNGYNLAVKIMATVTYPGAKLGRLLHNL